jgi:hypothetical protein
VWGDLADEAVLLDLESGVYYGLDPVGARIWQLVQAPTTVGAVREAIVAEFDVAPERCERDLLALLRDLARAGLLDVRDGPTP